MAEVTKPSPNQRQEQFSRPLPLTKQEIESLRQDKKEIHKDRDWLKDVKSLAQRPKK